MTSYPLIAKMRLSIVQSMTKDYVVADDLERVLEKAVKVYGPRISEGDTVCYTNNRNAQTHSALLICIEEIKKECVKHEPYLYSVNAIYRPEGRLPEDENYKCRQCGIRLVQRWEPINE